MKQLVILFGAGLAVLEGYAGGAPSEDYLDAARAAYVRPEYAAGTNTVITQWTTSSLNRADCPVPGGRIGWVAVEGMRNVRDIGGWNGLRTGRAYRGTEPDGHRKDGVPVHGLEITSNGLETIRSVMRIKTDLDLRGAGECPHPDVSSLGVALVRAPVRAYNDFDATKDKWAVALRLFADARNYPIYFHCWGGADRTGQLAFLLEGLCGVSECDLCIDYELTTFGGYPRLRSRGFIDLLNRIKSRPGTELKDRFADFVERELGLSKREIAAIRSNLMAEKTGAVPERVLELRSGPGNPRNSEGDFIRLKDGRVLFVYSHYTKGTGGDHDPAHLCSRVSADGGRTWSKQSLEVVANDGGMNVMSVSFLRRRDGSIGLFYLLKNSERDCRPVMRISKDEGKTWAAPITCVPDSEVNYYVLNNCRAARLASGRIVLPMCVHAPDAKTGRTADWHGKLVCWFSDDDGLTWRRGSAPFATFDEKGRRVTTQEPGVVELKDGRVLMYARTAHGRQWFYYSKDGCETWTNGDPGSLFGPCGPATLKRLANGDLFAVWNDHEDHPEVASKKIGDWGRRVPLSVAVSKDEGRTWRPRHTLEGNPNGWYCYIAALEVDDSLLLGYCAMNGLKDSRITRVPISWIYEPEPARKASASKPSVFAGMKDAAFETLKTPLGAWTAAKDHAAVKTWARGTGVHLLGGTDREVTLSLPKAAASDALKLGVERFTARDPYDFRVEARTVDGAWHEVYAEGKGTPVGRVRSMSFKKLPTPVTAYRFRCTSVLGALITDQATEILLDGFFND